MHVVVGLQIGRDFEPVHPRHHHVEHDQIGVLGRAFSSPSTPSLAVTTTVPLHLEVHLEEALDHRVVIDNQDEGGGREPILGLRGPLLWAAPPS